MTSPEPATMNGERPNLRKVDLVGIAAACLAGAAVRLAGLGRQILAGDEVSVLAASKESTLFEALTTYGAGGASIPLTAWMRLLLDLGIQPAESWLRAPVVLAGLAMPLVLAWVALRWCGPRAAVCAAWLGALSPMLVFCGRIARPYGPAVLLSTLAIGALVLWWQKPSRRLAAIYGICAALAVWWHPLSAPAVAAPLAWAVASSLRRNADRSARALIFPALSFIAPLLVLLGPAQASLREAAASKLGTAVFDAPSINSAGALLAGSDSLIVSAGFWLLAGFGLWRARHQAWVGFAVSALLVQLAALLMLAPTGGGLAPHFARSSLAVLPLALIAIASLAGEWVRGGQSPARILVVGIGIVGWLLAGPLADARFYRSPFAHHRDFMGFYSPAELPETLTGGAYAKLARESGGGRVMEAPWHPEWRFVRLLDSYQQIHGREVVAATVERPLFDPIFSMDRIVLLEPESILASDARWLVFHLDWRSEDPRADLVRRVPRDTVDPQAHRVWRFLRRQGNLFDRQLQRAFGPPVLRDRHHLLWDLAAVREARSEDASTG